MVGSCCTKMWCKAKIGVYLFGIQEFTSLIFPSSFFFNERRHPKRYIVLFFLLLQQKNLLSIFMLNFPEIGFVLTTFPSSNNSKQQRKGPFHINFRYNTHMFQPLHNVWAQLIAKRQIQAQSQVFRNIIHATYDVMKPFSIFFLKMKIKWRKKLQNFTFVIIPVCDKDCKEIQCNSNGSVDLCCLHGFLVL